MSNFSQKIKVLAVMFVMAVSLGVAASVPISSMTSGQAAAATGPCTKKTFFGLVPWYQYLTLEYKAANVSGQTKGVCVITNFESNSQNSSIFGSKSPILLILLAIIDDMLRLVGLLAVGFVIYGGIRFMISQGEPGEVAKARTTVINALVGLGIALVAITVVSFIGSALK